MYIIQNPYYNGVRSVGACELYGLASGSVNAYASSLGAWLTTVRKGCQRTTDGFWFTSKKKLGPGSESIGGKFGEFEGECNCDGGPSGDKLSPYIS